MKKHWNISHALVLSRLLLLGLLLPGWAGLFAQEIRLPELKTKSATYTNVVVTRQTATDLYIQHERGIGNVRISDIEDDAALLALGLKPAGKEESFGTEVSEAFTKFTGTNQSLQALKDSPAWARLEKMRAEPPPLAVLLGIGAGMLVVYLFGCFCLKLICVKAGHDPGALIWIPILQGIPMFRAAGMSAWWLLAGFIPLLNFVVAILWSFKIVQARGKSLLWAVALLLPLINLLALLYLAFSAASESAGKIAARDKV